MIRSATRVVGVLVFAALAAAPAAAGWKEIPIDVAVPARLETQPGEKTLVARFRASDHERIDIGLEVARWVKREIARQTSLSVIDVTPPPIPEQRPERMAVNDTFWRQLGKDFGADLIVSGVAEYSVADRSGFVTEDVVSPVTGQTVRQSRFTQLTGFRLKLQVFFFKGDNGALLHDGIWSDERVMEGAEPEDLQVLYELLDTMADDLRAVLLPVTIKQSRFIWVE